MKKTTAEMAIDALRMGGAALRHAMAVMPHDDPFYRNTEVTERDNREAIAALEADAAQVVEPAFLAMVTALRFYANGSHLHIDGDSQEFDTVSGEPENWLFSCKDEDATMLEDGAVARAALQGRPVLWIEGDDDDTPKPIDGEVIYAAPQEPAAPDVNAEMLEALKEIAMNDPYKQSSAGIIARAAIAKATGGAT